MTGPYLFLLFVSAVLYLIFKSDLDFETGTPYGKEGTPYGKEKVGYGPKEPSLRPKVSRTPSSHSDT
jgi:hypothetical protein